MTAFSPPVRSLTAAVILASPLAVAASPAGPAQQPWSAIVEEARGQSVFFNAWGGDPRINAYIGWVGDQLEARYGVDLRQVKVPDTGVAVSRVLAEHQAGNTDEGAVDMIWINGENFATLKRKGLLYGPWAESLPNFELTDPDGTPAVRRDFTVPVEGFEAPWTRAQLAFYFDRSLVDTAPESVPALLEWAQDHPGEFTYPKPPQFLGTTFLKQALLALTPDREPLYGPVTESSFQRVSEPLWQFLDQLHPHLWREGRAFADNGPGMQRLMADGEVSVAFTFNPLDPAAAIANNRLPPTVETYFPRDGSLGNFSFLAIPFNAQHKAGAMVAANFMLSPEAQARKLDPDSWGSPTVLSMDALSDGQRAHFEAISHPGAAPDPGNRVPVIPEPHPSWVKALEKAWQSRYGGG